MKRQCIEISVLCEDYETADRLFTPSPDVGFLPEGVQRHASGHHHSNTTDGHHWDELSNRWASVYSIIMYHRPYYHQSRCRIHRRCPPSICDQAREMLVSYIKSVLVLNEFCTCLPACLSVCDWHKSSKYARNHPPTSGYVLKALSPKPKVLRRLGSFSIRDIMSDWMPLSCVYTGRLSDVTKKTVSPSLLPVAKSRETKESMRERMCVCVIDIYI